MELQRQIMSLTPVDDMICRHLRHKICIVAPMLDKIAARI